MHLLMFFPGPAVAVDVDIVVLSISDINEEHMVSSYYLLLLWVN